MSTVSKGNLFPAEVVSEIYSKVQGKSSIAALANQTPISFTGNEIFTFSMDNEISIVAENAAKPDGGMTVETVTVQPVKVVYQGRVSDEFMHAADDKKIEILSSFTDGYAKKLAKGLDIMAMHGLNPADSQASSLITSYLDQVTNTVAYTDDADAAISSAIALLGEYDVSGLAIGKSFAGFLAAQKYTDGTPMYPELKWGGQPGKLNGVSTSINSTVETGGTDYAIVGDFENAFKWGYALQIPVKVIEYGDPDGNGDLQRYNQVLLRAETYLGFAVLDTSAFARVTAA